jgi:hypothetical protein
MARTAAGWYTYSDVGELLSELELTSEDMARAREATDDHIRARHQPGVPLDVGPQAPVERFGSGVTGADGGSSGEGSAAD